MNKKIIIILISIILLLISNGIAISISCIKIKNHEKLLNTNVNDHWTVMVYLDGDNNLEPDAIDDFIEMSSVGSTENVNIIVQLDRVYGYSYSYGDWTSTKRFFVEKNMKPYPQNALLDIGEANMGDPETLIDFATWAKATFPADNYALILWDHGSGWKSNPTNDKKWICEDDTDNDYISTSELNYAMNVISNSGSDKIEIIGFDACLMGMIEIAYELKDYGEYMVASEETEPISGWNYNGSLDVVVKNPEISPIEFAEIFVNTYYGYEITLSSVDLQKIDTLVNSINILSTNIKNNNIYRSIVKYAAEKVLAFQDYDYVDLYHFAELIHDTANDELIKNSAMSVMTNVELTVTAENHDYYYQNAHGISIYLPYYGYDERYANLLFSQNTNWDELIIWLYTPPSSSPPADPSIDGPRNGNVNTRYTYNFISNDPENDDIYYFVDWGIYDKTSIIGPKRSGESSTGTNSWDQEGAFLIKAKAIDENGACSDWVTIQVTMPKSKNKKISYMIDIFNWFKTFKIF